MSFFLWLQEVNNQITFFSFVEGAYCSRHIWENPIIFMHDNVWSEQPKVYIPARLNIRGRRVDSVVESVLASQMVVSG
jgi:hypothetical protein